MNTAIMNISPRNSNINQTDAKHIVRVLLGYHKFYQIRHPLHEGLYV